MIEVAKIVTHRELDHYPSYPSSYFENPRSGHLNGPSRATYRDTEWVIVAMDATGVKLTLAGENKAVTKSLTVTDPDKLIELAQVLMKAAESQADYAKANKALTEQMTKLDETFKDRISGLGLKEPDKAAMLRVVSNDDGVIEA